METQSLDRFKANGSMYFDGDIDSPGYLYAGQVTPLDSKNPSEGGKLIVPPDTEPTILGDYTFNLVSADADKYVPQNIGNTVYYKAQDFPTKKTVDRILSLLLQYIPQISDVSVQGNTLNPTRGEERVNLKLKNLFGEATVYPGEVALVAMTHGVGVAMASVRATMADAGMFPSE